MAKEIITSPRKNGTGPRSNSRPTDQQSDSLLTVQSGPALLKGCVVAVCCLCPFHTLSWVDLLSVIVAFPSHTTFVSQ